MTVLKHNSVVIRILKALLDIGMLGCLILFLVTAISGPVDYSLLGVRLTASHPFSPLEIFFVILVLRLLISLAFRDLILVCASAVFALAVAEVVLRVWGAPIANRGFIDIHVPSPVFGWALTPGAAGYGGLGELYEINSAGLRDKEYPLSKAAGTSRIAIIGDSFTFGMGVNVGDTFPDQLETLLAAEVQPVEVINFGVIGHNMWQYLETLQHKALAFGPDLVVLAVFEDDIIMSIRPDDASAEGYTGNNPFRNEFASEHISHFYLVNFLRNIRSLYEYKHRAFNRQNAYIHSIADRKKFWGPDNPTDPNYQMMAGKSDQRIYDRFSSALAEFAKAARTKGSEVLLILIPDSVQLNDPHLQAVNQRVKAAAMENAVPFLDLTPVLESQDDVSALYLFPYDAHNSPLGLRVIAEAIAEAIKRRELLTTVRTNADDNET